MAHPAYLAVYLNGAKDETLFQKLHGDLESIGWHHLPEHQVASSVFNFTKPLSIDPGEVETLAVAIKSLVETHVWPDVSIQLATYEHGPVVL